MNQFVGGMRVALPAMVAAAPFGVLFGALAIDNGFTVTEAVLMSAALFAGASQMVGIELFNQNVAPWLVVFSIFAVNFRHVLYSAAIGRHIRQWPWLQQAVGFFFLTDPQFAEAERKVEQGEKIPFVWYIGIALPFWLFWILETWLGALFRGFIPDTHALGLDFLLTIYFLGLVMGFRKRPLWLPVVAASSLASIAAYLTVGSPWHVSLGAAVGVALAAALPVRKGAAV